MSATGQRIVFDEEVAAGAAASGTRFPNLHHKAPSATQMEAAGFRDAWFAKGASVCAVAADFLTATSSVLAAEFANVALHGKGIHASMPDAMAVAVLAGLFVVLLLKSERAYGEAGSLLQIRATERAIRISMQALAAVIPFSFVLRLHFSHTAILASLLFVPALLILEKQMLASWLRALLRHGYIGRRVVVYAAEDAGRRVVSALLYSPLIGLRPVAAIEDDPEHPAGWIFELGYRRRCSIPVRRGPATALLLKSCACETLVIATANLAQDKLTAAARAAKQAGIRVAYLANGHPHAEQWADWIDIDGLLLTSIADPIAPWHYAIAKRIVDLVVSSFFLALLAPLLLVIALLIRLDSPGPALFIQKRVGLHGRLFDIYKFRSMHIDVPKYDVSPSTSSDRRITRIGRLLRRTSLDELPQLMNVLLGDMSLVGPRPEMPFIAELYDARQRERLQAIPGITGLWQLSADRVFQIHKNIEYDLYYIRNRTFCMDLAILIHTLLFAMHGV